MFGDIPLYVTIPVAAVLWIGLALRRSLPLRHNGRRWWVWFIISIFFTVIPATLVAYTDYFRYQRRRQAEAQAQAVRRCPHCGVLLAGAALPRAGGKDLCPHCRLSLDDEHYA